METRQSQALAGDFHGTIEGPLACTPEDLDAGGCHLSVLQQTTGSHFLAAQNKRGGSALVTTTSIYSRYGEPKRYPVTESTAAMY